MKKQIYTLMLALCCCVFIINAAAGTIPAERQKPRLVDEAGLLESSRAAVLLEKLDEISRRQKCDVAVVTVNSLEGKRSDAYADDFYDYNGYGMGPGYDGILLLVCVEDRDWAITTYGFAIPAFTDAGQAYMAEQFKPDLSAGNYSEAFGRFAELCDEFLTQARNSAPFDNGNLPDSAAPFSLKSFLNLLPLALIIGIIASLVITSAMKSKLKSVRSQAAARNYLREGSLKITRSSDVFLYKTVSKTVRASSSSGGGSGIHRSSSGRSHGGSRGKF